MKREIDTIKETSIKHQDLITYEQVYALNVTLKSPMPKRIKFAIMINELRQELQMPKLDFKEEVKYIQKKIDILQS